MTIKIDLSKVKTGSYIRFLRAVDEGRDNLAVAIMLEALDPAIEGGTLDRSLAEVPAILAQWVKELTTFSEDVNIAIASMSQYLKGKQGD